MKKSYKYAPSIIFLAFILHIFAINFFPVNFEYTFIEGMEYVLQNFDKKIISTYFENQANTFFFSFIGSLIKYIFPFIDTLYVAKFLSASGYFFLGFGIINLYKILKINFSLNLLLTIVFLNPLIWTFGYRGTPDFLSAGMSIYSISLILDKKIPISKNYLGFFLLGIAIALKPITGIFYMTYLLFLFNEKISFKKKINKIFIISFITFLIPFIYFLLIYINFKFFLTPPYYSKAILLKSFYVYNFFNTFLLYSSFLFIVCIPLWIDSFIKLTQSKNILIIIASITFFFICYHLIYKQSEINFGIFSRYLNPKFINGFFGFCFILFYYLFFKKIKIDGYFYFTIPVYLLLLSFILPAQRYLLLIIPLVYLFFLNKQNLMKSFFISCVLLIPLNFILLINQYKTGYAAINIVKYLKLNNLIDKTCPAAVDAHVGNYFKNSKNCSNLQFHVIENNNNNLKFIYKYDASFFFLKKEFYIININQN
jgi:hypothetical protein